MKKRKIIHIKCVIKYKLNLDVKFTRSMSIVVEIHLSKKHIDKMILFGIEKKFLILTFCWMLVKKKICEKTISFWVPAHIFFMQKNPPKEMNRAQKNIQYKGMLRTLFHILFVCDAQRGRFGEKTNHCGVFENERKIFERKEKLQRRQFEKLELDKHHKNNIFDIKQNFHVIIIVKKGIIIKFYR